MLGMDLFLKVETGVLLDLLKSKLSFVVVTPPNTQLAKLEMNTRKYPCFYRDLGEALCNCCQCLFGLVQFI